jgi:hypothetical protein
MRAFEPCNVKVRLTKKLRRLSLSLIFLFSCLGFAQPQLDDYAPGIKVRSTVTTISHPERQPKRDFAGSIQALITGQHSVFTAVFVQSFLRFDRKQNTRLWPFVSVGTTRAPPAEFSL